MLKYDSGSEFYELSYWIRFCSKVLKYPSGYPITLTKRYPWLKKIRKMFLSSFVNTISDFRVEHLTTNIRLD
jgi:hypothetical protein